MEKRRGYGHDTKAGVDVRVHVSPLRSIFGINVMLDKRSRSTLAALACKVSQNVAQGVLRRRARTAHDGQ